MRIATRVKNAEIKLTRNDSFEHKERPIVELSEEMKEKYKLLPYPIMGGISVNEMQEN